MALSCESCLACTVKRSVYLFHVQHPRSVSSTNTMSINQSLPRTRPVSPTHTNPIDTEQHRPRIPQITFRILIIGRANAGKTTILQRVCDTTESPTIYRQVIYGTSLREQVRPGGLTILPASPNATQVRLDPSVEVSDKRCCLLSLPNSDSAWRARHRSRTGVLQPYELYFS